MSTLNDSAYNVTTLAALTGMPKATAAAWIRCEGQGTPNPTNPLNIGYWGYSTQRPGPHSSAAGAPGSGFARYTSALAGLTDAARMIATSGHYVGIRNAIATRDAVKVAQAIEASPWATGHYGGGPGKAGCIVKGVNGGAAPSSGGTGGAPPAATTASTSSATVDTLRALGIDTTSTHVLTEADVWKIAMRATGQDPGKPLDPANSIYQGYKTALVGKTVAQMAADYDAGKVYGPKDPLTAIADTIAGLVADLPGLAVNGGVLVLVVLLGYKGFERILAD